jgi:hypothetical protein
MGAMPVVVMWICGRSVAIPCGNQSGSGPANPDDEDEDEDEDDVDDEDDEDDDDDDEELDEVWPLELPPPPLHAPIKLQRAIPHIMLIHFFIDKAFIITRRCHWVAVIVWSELRIQPEPGRDCHGSIWKIPE